MNPERDGALEAIHRRVARERAEEHQYARDMNAAAEARDAEVLAEPEPKPTRVETPYVEPNEHAVKVNDIVDRMRKGSELERNNPYDVVRGEDTLSAGEHFKAAHPDIFEDSSQLAVATAMEQQLRSEQDASPQPYERFLTVGKALKEAMSRPGFMELAQDRTAEEVAFLALQTRTRSPNENKSAVLAQMAAARGQRF